VNKMKCDIWPVNPGTYTVPEYGGRVPPELVGGACNVCQALFYPKPKYCPTCLGKIVEKTVGGSGRVHSLTVIRTKPPLGLPQPYSVGYVDLDKTGLRVFGLLDPEQISEMKLGSRVRLSVRELGHDGRGKPRLRPIFTLSAENGAA
jgi:uncharacterized OB-fold protein